MKKSRKALSPIIERNKVLNEVRFLPIEEKIPLIKAKYGLTHGNKKHQKRKADRNDKR